MAQQVTLYRILIASPSDVKEERDIAKNVIYQWNTANSAQTGATLMPVMWETDILPSMGGDPQEIINQQIVDECDLAVALFWTRIGSKTKNEKSGTVEEIQRTISNKKHVLVGFSQSPCPPSFFDSEQMLALREFQSECEKKGIIFTYSTHDDFRHIFYSHLSKITSNMTNSPAQQKFSMKKGQESSSYDVRSDMERLSIQAKVNHDADMLAINHALTELRKNTTTIKVLDVGCGYGHVTAQRFGHTEGLKVLGIDKSPEAIEIAKNINPADNIEYTHCDYHDFPEEENDFDIIFCAQFLQHVDHPEAALRQLWKMVTPGGFIIARNSDDGADIIFPFSDDLEQLIAITDKLLGSSDRIYGRKLYTHLKRLYPSPQYTNMYFNVLSTAGLTPKERGEYFTENHSFRLNYFRDIASRPQATPTDIKLLHKFEKIYATHEQKYIKDDDVFEAAVQFIGIAQKEST